MFFSFLNIVRVVIIILEDKENWVKINFFLKFGIKKI